MGRQFRWTLFVTLALGGCGGGSSGGGVTPGASNPPPVDSCSVAEQNKFVDDVMRDIYYWLDELPVLDPAGFASPEALLDALVYTDLDRFSAIVDEAEETAFFSASQFIGVGMGIRVIDDDRLRVTQTFADGPAAAAGIDRGYEVFAINGLTIAEALAGDGVSAAFGADAVGTRVDLRYADLAGTEMEATLFKDLVTIETVTTTAVFDVAGTQTGYLAFRNFVEPSFAALDDAFAGFVADGVEQLILDLRYNGGGLVSVAEFLGNLLGGAPAAGDVFARRVHNRLNTSFNQTTLFADDPNALDLQKIAVITTGATASASEMVINGLTPFAEVTLIGADTFGKPVGSYGYSFCGKILRPISFATENALGNTDYFAGFAVDCAAPDDLEHALGDPLEASLAAAIDFLGTGACVPAVAAVSTGQHKRGPPRTARAGWRQLVNAY